MNQRICNYNEMSVIIFTISNFANAEVRMNAGIGQLITRSLQGDVVSPCFYLYCCVGCKPFLFLLSPLGS